MRVGDIHSDLVDLVLIDRIDLSPAGDVVALTVAPIELGTVVVAIGVSGVLDRAPSEAGTVLGMAKISAGSVSLTFTRTDVPGS
jgi:hypothetical protein